MKQTALLLLLLLQQVSLCTGLFRGSSSSRWQNEDEEEAAAIAEERDLLNTRIVGGSAVNDASKYTYFTEWHGQFCGGKLALLHCERVCIHIMLLCYFFSASIYDYI